MKEIGGAIVAVVEGDLSALPTILKASQSDLLCAATSLPQLTVSKVALLRVLTAWRSGDRTAQNVHQWASFIRRGYVSGKMVGEVQPIDIDYDETHEDLIVEIIGRLDEVGDFVDGEIDDLEKDIMIDALSS